MVRIWDYFLEWYGFFRSILSLSCIWVTGCLQNRAGTHQSGQCCQKEPLVELYNLLFTSVVLFQHLDSIASWCFFFFLRTWKYQTILNLYTEQNNICSFFFSFLTSEWAEAQWLILTQLRFFRRGKAEWGLKPVSPSYWFVWKIKGLIDIFWELSMWTPASQNIEGSLELPFQAAIVSYQSGFLEQVDAVSYVTLYSRCRSILC